MSIQVVILAAGQGKRMYSSLPKVLHLLAGKPLLSHVMETAKKISDKKPVIVIGHQSEKLREAYQHDASLEWVLQDQQLGTGHALMQAFPQVSDQDDILVLYGDVPLTSVDTLKKLIDATNKNEIGMLTAIVENPKGYGRIKRDANGKVISIVEDKDANNEERTITEINPGIYFVPARLLKKWLPLIKNNNAQQEYYLTDIISLSVKEHIPVSTVHPSMIEEILGVNDCVQLAFLERFYQRQMAEKFLRQGVTIIDPARFDVRGDIKIGRDVVIDVNVILEGNNIIGDECRIGANSILCNSELGNHVEVKANSMIDGAKIGNHSVIGPFARIRPETVLEESVHVGNFVEVKKSLIGKGSKANHLSYIGDAEIGSRVNVGAGTITCNYDGYKKHKTIIGNDVFIGSDTQLIAPVMVGDGAVIGAGSTIQYDVPAHHLALSRAKQESKSRKKKL